MGYGSTGPETPTPRVGRRRGRPQAARPDDPPSPHPSSLIPHPSPREAFLRDYRDKTAPTRRILEHLLHQTFAGSPDETEPEADLLLDPNPDQATIRGVLGRYPFRDVDAAYANLVQLAQEAPFLSPRRCRHFLASIAPALLRAIAETPDPDMALLNLEKVTGSLGAKAVLWELFSFNPPSLKLYVELCASSQYLSEILINNPGMIDELLDSLVLNQPRPLAELEAELLALCRGAADPEPILHSFQDKELLRIGVGDILGKQSIRETTAALSDLAEAVLVQVARNVYLPVEARHGVPLLAEGPRWGQPCRVAVIALGKLGSREMNYHSDLDLLIVYEGEGRSYPPEGAKAEPTEAGPFYTEFAQRLIRMLGQPGPMGRLYQVDMRLRPAGGSGSLVLPLAEFRAYYGPGGPAQLWERQALTRGRVVHAEGDFDREVREALPEAAYGGGWRPQLAAEIAAMRERLEASRPARDLKRGPGGLADIEFLVQRLLLEHGAARPELRTPNTWDALDGLRAAGALDEGEHRALVDGYAFLLRVQNRLRIVHNRTLDAVPESAEEVEKLARRLGCESAERLLERLEGHRRAVREVYRRRITAG
jgi:glutamate-ammonia-ligase adenylyltransferase